MVQFAMIFLSLFISEPAESIGNPEELGNVQWERSLEKAVERSTKEDKPILILFQEIPGCATCRNYGNNVLTDPYVVEAIETYFIPLAIYNNKGGADADVLKKFDEPTWNNPVVRVVRSDLDNISDRLNGNYSAKGLISYMTNALIKLEGKAPSWLSLIEEEYALEEGQLETSVYSMYCFWSGEAHFGKVQGVYETEAGFANGKEVVKLKYDPKQISKTALDKLASQGSCTYEEKVNGYRTDKTPHYYLQNSTYKNIDMTPLQATRVNSALGERQDPASFLSPKQLSQIHRS